MPNRLYMLPVPLAEGGAGHLPPAALSAIAETGHYLVENERTARRAIGGLKLGVDVRSLTFYKLDKRTPVAEVERAFDEAPADAPLGVLSEAGCPGVADPGASAASVAHRRGVPVVPVSGPSSFLLALMASGMNGQSFAFSGYLPVDKAKRKQAILHLEALATGQGQTQIFMETPYRNGQLLEALLKTCRADTSLCIAVDLTAPEQSAITRKVGQWRADPPDLQKRPAVFLLGR